MKANKRTRDLSRLSARRLYVEVEGQRIGVTTYPVDFGDKANDVQETYRANNSRSESNLAANP